MLRFWLLGLLAVGFATADYYDIKTADKEFLIKQKKVYNLLYHISQPNLVNIPLYNEGRAWSIQDNLDSYSNRTAVKEFLQMYQLGMLPRGEVFSVYYPKMLKQMEALFNVFYTANDFDVFYNTALWARININEAQFMFALYNAVIRRPDTQYIQLPPPYEMYPYAFFNSEVLEKAHHAKIFGKLDPQKSAGFDTYIIPANYSGWYVNREYDLENKLNYFTEDIGLSAYYFYFRQNYPCWLKSKDHSFPNYRGVEYLYGHKQLINRYNLERLSNDLPKIGDFDWQRPFYAGYYPSMTYQNGLPLPQRPQWSPMPQNKFALMKDIMNMESRVSSVIDSGYIISIDGKKINIYTPEGLNMLGNIIEGNADSTNMNFYGNIDSFGRKILGFNPDATNSYQIVPSALEMFTTSMRDPAFYRLYKRIVDYYYRYKMRQQPYNKEDIVYPNLVIESFTVDKLITYFDQFDASISNGLLVESQAEAEKSLIKIRQYRLNHKPFNFHMAINAANPTKASIKIFLGPKYDSHHKLMELPENLKDFYEIDNWMVDLNAGTNKIVRSSKNIFFLSPDQEPSELFYQRLLKSIDDGEEFNYAQRISGFPERLLLPRGKREGMPFQLFVYVNPVSTEQTYTSRIWGNYKFDDNPFGFPLDKPVYDYNYDGPNMAFKDVLIYHKEEFDMNIPY